MNDGTPTPGIRDYLYNSGPTEDAARATFERNHRQRQKQGFAVFADPGIDVEGIRTRTEALARGITPTSPVAQRGIHMPRLCEWQWGWFEPVWVLEDV